MLSRLGVPEALGQTKINDVYVVLLLADTNKEVIGFDISVEEVARVNEFDSLKLKSIVRFKCTRNVEEGLFVRVLSFD